MSTPFAYLIFWVPACTLIAWLWRKGRWSRAAVVFVISMPPLAAFIIALLPVVGPENGQIQEPAGHTPAVVAVPTETILPIMSRYTCVPAFSEREIAQVRQVIDGDTIEVVIAGRAHTVRYIGIDALDSIARVRLEPYYANREMVEGRTVTLIQDVTDAVELTR